MDRNGGFNVILFQFKSSFVGLQTLGKVSIAILHILGRYIVYMCEKPQQQHL